MILIELGFSLGLVVAAFLSISSVSRNTLLFFVVFFAFSITGVIKAGYPIFGYTEPSGFSGLMVSSLIATGVLVFVYAKKLRIAIDELGFVAQLAILWFVLLREFSSSPELLLAVLAYSIVTVVPLLYTVKIGKLARFFYYSGYSLTISFVFFTFIGLEGLNNSILSLDPNLNGGVQAFIIGLAFFYYLVHLVFLLMLIPNKKWDRSLKYLYEVLPNQFRSTQHHVTVLVLCFISSYTSLYFLSLITDSILVNIGIVTSVVSYVGYETHKRQHRQYLYTKTDLIPD